MTEHGVAIVVDAHMMCGLQDSLSIGWSISRPPELCGRLRKLIMYMITRSRIDGFLWDVARTFKQNGV